MPDPNLCPYCPFRHPVSSLVQDHIRRQHPQESKL